MWAEQTTFNRVMLGLQLQDFALRDGSAEEKWKSEGRKRQYSALWDDGRHGIGCECHGEVNGMISQDASVALQGLRMASRRREFRRMIIIESCVQSLPPIAARLLAGVRPTAHSARQQSGQVVAQERKEAPSHPHGRQSESCAIEKYMAAKRVTGEDQSPECRRQVDSRKDSL